MNDPKSLLIEPRVPLMFRIDSSVSTFRRVDPKIDTKGPKCVREGYCGMKIVCNLCYQIGIILV